jgi:phosphatidylglycerophosphate synthase
MKPTKTKMRPTLPVDSERILEYRSIYQKPRQLEEIWSWYVLRRISIYVTLMLRRIGVTPNAVSWMSLLFFILTGWLILTAEPWGFLLAVLAYNLGYLCDCVDGELARITKVTSRKGVFLDTLIRGISIPKLVAFALAYYELIGIGELSFTAASGIYFSVLIASFALLVPLSYNYIDLKSDENDPVSDMRTSSKGYEWIAFFTGMPGFFACLPLCVLMDAVTGWSVTAGFILLFLAFWTVKTLVRLYLTTAKLN